MADIQLDDPTLEASQYKGTDPQSGKLTYYKILADGTIVAKFDSSADEWIYASQIGTIQRPGDLVPAITNADKEKIADDMASSGLFKPKTEYILIGDEPRESSGVIDLKASLAESDYQNLKRYLMLMPRQFLSDWFAKTVVPNLKEKEIGVVAGGGVILPPQVVTASGEWHWERKYEKLVWAAFVDLFNLANLEYVNQNQLEPWDWEQKKLDAYYISSSKEAIDQLDAELDAFADVSLAADPKAKEIMEQFSTLPRLGDVGLEINRQNAIKELLRQKDYLTAKAIVDAYRYASETVIGDQLTKPIPYDIASADGKTIVRASN